MAFYKWIVVVVMVSLATVLGNVEIHRGGWLSRVVQYHKSKFIEELRNAIPVQIEASIARAPKGYKDPKGWNFDSVAYLLLLIRGSEKAAPVYRSLRRMMSDQPTRRLMMSMRDSFKYFPSLTKHSTNEMYYDVGSVEDYDNEFGDVRPVTGTGDDEIITISNPVESRLPSSQISVRLLKEILTQRAIAAKMMPTTLRSTISWKPMKPTTEDTAASEKPTEPGDGESSVASDANNPAEPDEGNSENPTELNAGPTNNPAGTDENNPDSQTEPAP